MIILIIYFTGVGLENTWTTNLDVFFCQNDLHVLLTKQFYKINCEIIKIKINREKAFNKTMTKHIQNLNNIFWMLRQWWKSRIK